ncbi:ArsR/SmtB family transcription factor [Raineyella fluvialis]|uniref:Metalloregulator ArsR/SmtB family transcription factor n=1 Tax=Raineyella fluvialis TaxID=2662261 RepID=A0A5Q2F983_9ACTN|nr:metalloregulator ArsR/SmtB family transcription factor [Raineyella fluvialis]QGF23462.1 metalloregulator ArsR/SmtB family transcription factor [Raineyella fluvialis]
MVIESIRLEVSRQAASPTDAVTLLAVAADPVRWSILQRLAAQGTRCVCDLQPLDPIPQNKLSYHLKVLRDAGLVTSAKRGRWVDYTLAEDALERLHAALPGASGSCQGHTSCR